MKLRKLCSWLVVVALVIGLMPQAQMFSVSAGTKTTQYEAEDFYLEDEAKKIHTSTTNASGGKSVTLYPTDGDAQVTFTVSVEAAGTYDAVINMAANSNPAGSTVTDIPMEIIVNDVTTQTLTITNNKNYNSFTEYTVSVGLNAGENTITVKNACEDTTIFVNVDYLSISEEIENYETTTEDPSQYPAAVGRHEAENAIAFEQGSADAEHSISNNEAYSNGQAVGGMNTWPNNGRAYCTTKVNAEEAGTYEMTIVYAGGEANHPCNIDTRINGGEWVSTLAEDVTSWNDPSGSVTLLVELVAGVNTIDVTGACNIWYDDMGWEWINLDYFELAKSDEEITTTTEAPYAPTDIPGVFEAEKAETLDGTVGSNPAFSGSEYVEGMNTNVEGDMSLVETLTFRVNAPAEGNYKFSIAYATTSEDTKFAMRVGQGEWIYLHAKTTGSWATTAIKEAILTLPAGESTIEVTGSLDTGWLILDKIDIATTSEQPTIDPEETTLSDAPEEGMVKTLATDLKTNNLISFRGRNMVVGNAITFDYTASGFEFNYRGSGTVRANLTTTANEKFAVVVDGIVSYYTLNAKTGNIILAEDLADGDHTIKVYKTQEAMTGLAQLNYLMYDEEAELSPIEKDYNFLIIGASSTCGNQMDPDTGAENGYLAFPSVVSRAFNADWQQISCSGRGCTQGSLGENNWAFSQENQLADMYTYQSWFRDKETKHDITTYTPDVIITNFNNDFGSNAIKNGYSIEEVFTHMMGFIESLRTNYPNAYIIMSYGNYPNYDTDGGYINYDIIEKYKENVNSYKESANDDKIAFVPFLDLVNGQSGHPNADEHQYLAELLSAQISEFLNVENPLPQTHFEVEDGTIVNGDENSKFVQITTWASKFSNNAYAEGLNTNLDGTEIASDGSNVKYVSVPVKAAKDGMYNIELNYGTDATPEVYMRVNGGQWNKISLASTTDWAKVGQNNAITAPLKKGDNVIDITGATNNSYVCLDRIDTIFVRDLLPDDTTDEPSTDEGETTTPNEIPSDDTTTSSEVPSDESSTTVAPTTQAPTVEPSTPKPTKITAPRSTSIRYAKKQKAAKKIKLSIKRVKEAKGYQIAVYKTLKNAKKNKKAIYKKFVRSIKPTITNKKFKKANKLYVKVRAYKLNGKKKVYAKKWSKVKKVRIRK